MALTKDPATGRWKTDKQKPTEMPSAPDHNWYWNNTGRASGQGRYYQQAYQNIQRGNAAMMDPRVYEDLNNIFNQDKANYEKQLTEYNQDTAKADTRNKADDLFAQVKASTAGGDYVKQRDILKNKDLGLEAAGFSKAEADSIKNTMLYDYKTFYTQNKLQTWDSNLGAKPPYGVFDAAYYKAQNPVAAQQWQSAVANDDIDITQRYGENGFYLNHYTTQGKPAGARGNKTEELAAAKQYVERKPTDIELQQARTIQLGVNTDTQTERLLKVPEVAAAWEAAKAGDTYWKSKGKEFFLDLNKPDEFAVLFRMSDRPEDKEVSFKYNINAGY